MAGTAYLFIRKIQRANEYELKIFSKMFVLILKNYLGFKNYVDLFELVRWYLRQCFIQ